MLGEGCCFWLNRLNRYSCSWGRSGRCITQMHNHSGERGGQRAEKICLKYSCLAIQYEFYFTIQLFWITFPTKHFYNEIQVFLHYILNPVVNFVSKLYSWVNFFLERAEINKNTDFIPNSFEIRFSEKNTWVTSSIFAGFWDIPYIQIIKRKQWSTYWIHKQLGWKGRSLGVETIDHFYYSVINITHSTEVSQKMLNSFFF